MPSDFTSLFSADIDLDSPKSLYSKGNSLHIYNGVFNSYFFQNLVSRLTRQHQWALRWHTESFWASIIVSAFRVR